MSRIGKLPIEIPAGVTINVSKENLVTVKGPLGTLSQKVDTDLEVAVEANQVVVKRPTEQKRHRAMHGLYRSLLNNMVVGVSKGYEVKLELVGVGYRAEAQNQVLDLVLGFSHHTYLQIPNEVKVVAVTDKRSNPVITLSSVDKQLIGHVAAKIRSFRPPEPYKGKGVKFVGEKLRRKAGKTASKK
jgi:large subunit ribosomal protein L6